MLRTDLYKVLQSKTERGIEITCYVFKNKKKKMRWEVVMIPQQNKHILSQNCALKNDLDSKYYVYFGTMKNNFLNVNNMKKWSKFL